MELTNTFVVPAPLDKAWRTLLDVERVAPCMPGATLESFDGESFNGTVKIKIGAIQMTYGGQGRFLERDEEERRVRIQASGKERRGGGNAAATIDCQLTPADEGTRIDVSTDLAITGKPAQFGRGALQDISTKIVDQFAANLSTQLTATQPAPDMADPDAVTPHVPVHQVLASGIEPLDLLDLAGPALKRKLVAGLLAVVALLGLGVLLRRRVLDHY